MRNAGQKFFDTFIGNEIVVATAVTKMRDMGLSIDDVLTLYDDYISARIAEMTPATPEMQRMVPIRAQPRPADVRRQSGQADAEHRLGACPKCGAEVWGIKKCPHIAPPWRTFFVCDNDDCDYHGRSRLAVEQLRRRWPDGAEAD